MKTAVSSIRVGSRHRKEMGDLQGLADSIAAEGLLQPIGVTEDMDLVFGERRLRAIRDILKRDAIDIRIVKVSSIVAGEMAENEVRKDFTASERVAIAEAVKAEIGRRHGTNQFRGKGEEVDGGPPPNGKTRDLAAQRAGFGSGKQLERAANVVRFGVPKLVEKMDSGEVSVSAAATIAKAEPAVQKVIVELNPAERREAIARVAEDADYARRAAEDQEKATGPTAYTGFLKKNGRLPSAEEAKTLAKLDFRETPDATGKRHSPLPPLTKEQKAAEKRKEHVRLTVWHMFKGTSHLAACDVEPAEAAAMVYSFEEDRLDESLEKALTWLSAFAEEWKNRGK